MSEHRKPVQAEKDAPYVYDYHKAPNRRVHLPKTAPLTGLRAHAAAVAAEEAAEEARWAKVLEAYEAARAKAEAEGAEAPKAPVRPVHRKDPDLTVPVPVGAQDPDLLRLVELLGEGVEEVFEQSGELNCQVAPDRILEALLLCRDDGALRYEMLADQSGTHFPAGEGFDFTVVYHLTSISRSKRLRLRIAIPEGFEPESATAAFPSANWLEREIYDMLGIRFRKHPDMTRILCPEDWEAHPLRKEYPLVGWGQRDIDFREDRSGMLNRIALEKAGQQGINLKRPTAE
nr:NADH-quinone oxidoreductase subunit C [uncultured Holophaga sp.]